MYITCLLPTFIIIIRNYYALRDVPLTSRFKNYKTIESFKIPHRKVLIRTENAVS